MKSVLLSGCGNIGYRHLQAMTQMATPAAITVVEPNVAAHPRIVDLIAANSGMHRIDLHEHLPRNTASYDLAVVATTADTRRAAVKAIIAQNPVRVMVLEKILFPRVADIDEVAALLQENSVAAYVNCGRRYFPAYQEARLRWATGRPLDLTISGAAFGMGSNSIHLIDLAEYLNMAELQTLDTSGLQPGSQPAKRAGCVEIFGTLRATFSNGARLTIQCRDEPLMNFEIVITGQGVEVCINELTHQITEAQTTTRFATKNVSELSVIYDDALTEQRCNLTPYADSARQHRHFLTAICQHLGLPDSALCPIS